MGLGQPALSKSFAGCTDCSCVVLIDGELIYRYVNGNHVSRMQSCFQNIEKPQERPKTSLGFNAGERVFRFVRSDFVIVGTFNIYVLQPNWFTMVGLFTEGQKIAVQTDFARPGYHYSPSESEVEWHISPDRVTASAKNSDVDCGSQVAQVITKLEWTPLHAAGGNYVFEADRTEYEQLRVKPAVPGRDDWNWRQSASAITVESAGRQFNLTLVTLPEKLQFVANIHTDLSQTIDRKERLERAEDACISFKGDRERALDFAVHFFGMKFK